MATTNSVDIQCSNCGRIDRICYTTQNLIHTIQKGWNSFGSALYCPDCSKLGMKEIKIKSLWGSGIPLGLLMSGMTDNIRTGGNMACNCKHNEKEIQDGKTVINELRNLFIKRMTEDSDHNDRRKRDFNQAIFGFSDDKDRTAVKTYQIWSEMDMEMVLQCFDDAAKDWRRLWCDVENCRRK